MPPRPDVSEERKAQIIQAALACFTAKGYNNTTMADIVEESGLSKGAIYWYFKSKDDLFVAALADVLEKAGLGLFESVAVCPTATEKLRALGQATIGFTEMVTGYFGLFVEFWVSSPEAEKRGQFWVDVLYQFKDMVVAIIEEGIEMGEFRPVDAEGLVWAILAAYDGLAAYTLFLPDLDLERVNEVLVENVLKGLEVRD